MHDTNNTNILNHSPKQRAINLGLAALAAQAGCASLVIVFFALFLGLWLDSRLTQQGICTIMMLILSVPFSLYVMVRIALGAINKIQIIPIEPTEESTFE